MADIFEFRDFSMLQASSGQRINNDSCAFGSLINPGADPRNIIDIGAGTGLLSLMMAVRFKRAKITAVEPERSIADVARENFNASQWRDRLTVLQERAQNLAPSLRSTFDFVICNPPYFQNSMLSPDRLRTIARHNSDLSPKEVYAAMVQMMSDDGTAWLSFPAAIADLWLKEGREAQLHQTHSLNIQDNPKARVHIVIAGWSKIKPSHINQGQVCYRTKPQGEHSPWMRAFRDQWFPAKYNS